MKSPSTIFCQPHLPPRLMYKTKNLVRHWTKNPEVAGTKARLFGLCDETFNLDFPYDTTYVLVGYNPRSSLGGDSCDRSTELYAPKYSRHSLSRLWLSRITAYLKEKI